MSAGSARDLPDCAAIVPRKRLASATVEPDANDRQLLMDLALARYTAQLATMSDAELHAAAAPSTHPADFRYAPQPIYTSAHTWDPYLPGQSEADRVLCRQQAQNIDLRELVARRAQVAGDMLRVQMLVLEHPDVRRIKDGIYMGGPRPAGRLSDQERAHASSREKSWIDQQIEQRNQVYIYYQLVKGEVPELFSEAGGPSSLDAALKRKSS
jgi:hypothetical protein